MRIARAFRFTEKIAPDIPRPTDSGKHTTGWVHNSYNDRTEQGWSRWGSHGTGVEPRADWSGSQGGKALYSSELLALKAMRYEVEQICAKRLAAIDARIEKAIHKD